MQENQNLAEIAMSWLFTIVLVKLEGAFDSNNEIEIPWLGWFSLAKFDSNRQWNWRNARKAKPHRSSMGWLVFSIVLAKQEGVWQWNVDDSLQSGINVGVRLLFLVFFRGYILVKGGYVYYFFISYVFNISFYFFYFGYV